MKEYGEAAVQLPFIHNLGAWWRVVSRLHAAAALPKAKVYGSH
jgi:hypothetical protein